MRNCFCNGYFVDLHSNSPQRLRSPVVKRFTLLVIRKVPAFNDLELPILLGQREDGDSIVVVLGTFGMGEHE